LKLIGEHFRSGAGSCRSYIAAGEDKEQKQLSDQPQ